MYHRENPFSSRYVKPGAVPYAFFDGSSLESLSERFSQPLRSRAAIIGPHGSGKSTLLHSLVPHLDSAIWRTSEQVTSSPLPSSPLSSSQRQLESQLISSQLTSSQLTSSQRQLESQLTSSQLTSSQRQLESQPSPLPSQSPDASCELADGGPHRTTPWQVHWYRFTSNQHDTSSLFEDARATWSKNALVVIDGFEQLSWLARLRLRRRTLKLDCGLLVTAHRRIRSLPTLWHTSVNDQTAEFVVQYLLRQDNPLAERLLHSQRWQRARSVWDQNLRETLFDLYDWVEDLRPTLTI